MPEPIASYSKHIGLEKPPAGHFDKPAASKPAAKPAAPKAPAKASRSTSSAPRSSTPKRSRPADVDVVRETRRAQRLIGSGGSKPSTVGTAAKGAAKGAAVGAAVGSVVPGVGTAVGGGVGAVLGGAGGAVKGSHDKAKWKAANRSTETRALLAEFVVCLVIVALSPAAKPAGEVTAAQWMKRGSAVCALFIMLGLMSAVGPRTGRVAVAIGGLVTLGLLVDGREVFGLLASKLAPGAGQQLDTGDGGPDALPSARDAPTDPADRTPPADSGRRVSPTRP